MTTSISNRLNTTPEGLTVPNGGYMTQSSEVSHVSVLKPSRNPKTYTKDTRT